MFRLNVLKTEYCENPVGIDALRPRFLWNFSDDTDELQSAYRIVVTNRGKSVWDSGEIESPASVNIEYDGEDLKSTELYEVTVRTRSSKSVSEINGTFETALLHAEDWTGNWSGTNAVFTDSATAVRKIFSLEDKPIVRGRVYLIGLGYHELYINGKKVERAVLAPSNSDYTKSVYYKTYDITPHLKSGENIIAIELGNGWYGKKSFLAQMFVEYDDGTRYNDCSGIDGLWRVGRSSILRNNIFGGETHDNIAAEKIGEWKKVGYHADWNNGWMLAFHQLAETGVKRADMTDEVRVTAEYLPVSVKNVGRSVVYDFGQNLAGWVKITAKGERGTKISLRFAEELKKDGTINQLNLRTADCLDELILAGEATEEFEPHFTYHGFRYMQVDIEGTAEITSAVARHVHNDVRATGYFNCSDDVINRLHKNAVITELNNLHSIMTDCPQRDERLGWLNDLSSRIYQNVNNFDLSRMIPKILQDIRDTQNSSGAIADTAPYLGGTRPADPICASYILFGRFAYRYYGDKRVLVEFYDSYKAWVDCLLTYSADGIVELSYYGDWVVPECFIDTRVSGTYISSAYVCWQLKMLSEIAECIGNKKDADIYGKLHEKSVKSINRKWFDAEKVCYENNSQTANSLAISIGFAPDWARPQLIKHIKDDIVARGNHCTSGNQGYRHLFYVMAEAGETQLLLDVLKNPEYPGWGYMLANGATTVWERWEKEMQMEMHSFNHPMFGSYDGIFYHYLGGIKIDEDACACDKVTIRPHWNNTLEFVEASLDTVRGKIVSHWKKSDGKIDVFIKIPASVSAVLDFNGEIDGVKFERGKRVDCGEYKITVINS